MSGMTTSESRSPVLPSALVDEVLAQLGLDRRPSPDLEGLAALYAAWCARVPFDNLRKLVHVHREPPGPMPGGDAEDFFRGWLRYGTGGTCWAGNGALERLLSSLGFDATRGLGTMVVAQCIPPNHGFVTVEIDGTRHLVDASMLHGTPVPLRDTPTSVDHPAWGLRAERVDGTWHVHWRPASHSGGLVCRLDALVHRDDDFAARYERTRGWSPFNYAAYILAHRNGGTETLANGKRITVAADGTITEREIDDAERRRTLVEVFGISETLVSALPPDMPTPPPPKPNAT
jgi:arylamine N-acetyltransferase